MSVVHDFDEGVFRFQLMDDGKFIITHKATGAKMEARWFTDEKGKPWIPKKRKSFKSLMKTCLKEGDFDFSKLENKPQNT